MELSCKVSIIHNACYIRKTVNLHILWACWNIPAPKILKRCCKLVAEYFGLFQRKLHISTVPVRIGTSRDPMIEWHIFGPVRFLSLSCRKFTACILLSTGIGHHSIATAAAFITCLFLLHHFMQKLGAELWKCQLFQHELNFAGFYPVLFCNVLPTHSCSWVLCAMLCL